MKLAKYRSMFEKKKVGDVQGLCGRIIRGTEQKHFATLTDDPDRKLVMLMGPNGLQKIMGKSGYEALVDIGYESDYITRKVVDEGNQFKLVVFEEGAEAVLATWENVISIVSASYPQFADDLSQNLDALKNMSFEQIESMAGYSFAGVDVAGKSDSRFMTEKRFCESSRDVVSVRSFLYFTVHLRELFSGDGYTYDSRGNRGLMEYIVQNKNIADLGDHELIDMDVMIPQRSQKKSKRRKNMNVQLLIIDPQNDFMDLDGAMLPVPGSVGDMQRLAKLIDRVGPRLADIHVTLDSHRLIDIAQPAWWIDQDGNPPAPFTIISTSDVEVGIWTPRNPAFLQRSLEYVQELEKGGKYPLCIWPPHCLIGSWGHSVQYELNDALQEWSEREFAMVDYVTKGSNPWTEHYGALMAEVPDLTDPSTSINADFLNVLSEADIVAVAGEALSHCVKETVSQIADNIGEEHIKKFYILTDCTSPVAAIPGGPDFPAIADAWLVEMERRGMTLITSDQFMV